MAMRQVVAIWTVALLRREYLERRERLLTRQEVLTRELDKARFYSSCRAVYWVRVLKARFGYPVSTLRCIRRGNGNGC